MINNLKKENLCQSDTYYGKEGIVLNHKYVMIYGAAFSLKNSLNELSNTNDFFKILRFYELVERTPSRLQ